MLSSCSVFSCILFSSQKRDLKRQNKNLCTIFLSFLKIILLFLAVLGFPLVAESWGSSLAVVCWLLIVVASPVMEHECQGWWASVVSYPRLSSLGSIAVVHWLGCSMAYGILLDQGLNLCLLHWLADSSPLSHQTVLEKTLESSLDCKEIQPAHSKGNQP